GMPSCATGPASADPRALIFHGRSYSGSRARLRGALAGRVRAVRCASAGVGVDLRRQIQDLLREVEQLLVLVVLVLHGLPLLVREDLTLGVDAVLADHHERREEDRL